MPNTSESRHRPPPFSRAHSASHPLLNHVEGFGGNERVTADNQPSPRQSQTVSTFLNLWPSDRQATGAPKYRGTPVRTPGQKLRAAAQDVLVWALPLTVVFASIVAATLLYSWMSVAQWGKLSLGVQFRCAEQANRFVNELTTRLLAPVHTVRSFLLSQPAFNQEMLNRFCTVGGWGPLLRLVLAERVENVDRSLWEHQYNVTITEVDQVLFPNGSSFINSVRPRPLDSEGFYFPTRFFFPPTASMLLGFDQNYGARKAGFTASLKVPSNRVEATAGALTDSFPLLAGTGAPETIRYPIGIAYYAPLLPPKPDGSVWSVGGGFNIQTFINQTIAPDKLEQLGLRILVKVNGTLVYETHVNTSGPDTHVRANEEFGMAGQQIQIECIGTATGAAFYVTGWRYIAPCFVVVGGGVVAAILFQFLRKHRQLSQASRNIGSWKRYSEAILQATPNPMVSVDENGRISGLNKAFLDLTGYSISTLHEQSTLMDIISLCPPNSLLGLSSHHSREMGGDGDGDAGYDDPDSYHSSEAARRLRHILQPGKREVRIKVSPDTAISLGADFIESMATVSSRTSSKMSQVLVFTDLTEAKQRDAKLAHLVRMTDELNAQQAHVLTYLAHELTLPFAGMDVAMRVVEQQDTAAVGSAHRHLTEMHQAVAELVGVLVPYTEPTRLLQVAQKITVGSGAGSPMTLVYSNLDTLRPVTMLLEPASAQSILKFCTVAQALKATRVDLSVLVGGKMTVQCTLPDSVSDEDLQQLSPEFDWTSLGRGCDFALLGIHLVILRRQVALAQGSLSRSGRRLSMTVPYA